MKTRISFLMLAGIIMFLNVRAQWSTNPLLNKQISFSGSGSALPYVVAHPGGTTYIGWFTPGAGGNYFPWIQRLDAGGNFLWPVPGVFVSGHPSMTWITDYSLAVCPDTSVLISFQDMRATANDIFIYKISAAGDFLWGPDGIQLSDNADFEADPVMAVHPDNSVGVAWPRSPNTGDGTVVMQRLNSNGVKQWTSDLVLGESGFDYTWPRVIPAEDDNTLLVCYKEWGPYWAPNRNILAKKIDPQGNELWNTTPVLFSGATPVYVHPLVASDGLGGAFVCWFCEKIMNHLSTFVQHVDQNGNVTMGSNGIEMNANMSTLHLEPAIGADTVNHELYVFWRETDLNQNVYGLYGQRVSMDGTLHWGTNAKMFVPTGSKNVTIINVTPMNAGAVVSYFYDDWGSSTQQKVRAIRADSAGNTVWSGGTRDVSTAQSGKGNLSAGPFMNSQIIFAWYDDRLGGAQIFAQNLSENGDPGPLDYSFGLYPDTLYFLTEQDIHDGKPFYIVNPHDYSLGIQSIDQEGQFYNAPASWYTLPHYTQFPVTMPPMDSIADTVHWIILLKNAFTTLLYDTLEIRSLSQTSRLILALDSSLIITGVPGQEEEILTASPNPFTGPVRITGNFFNARQITVTVYNTLMQPVTRPVNILVPNGRLDFRWDGKDACGNRVSTGVYFITLKGTSGMKTIRVIAF